MSRYKVCVYAISKNEEQFVDRWMDSMQEADMVVVTDTGSTDGTVEKLRGRGAVVYEEKIEPWRFDVARNRSLDHVPKDMKICVCTDLDEVFSPGWRKKLERSWRPGAKMGKYWYNWSHKEDGSPDVQFQYFKVHERFSYRWAYPVHECLKYCGNGPEVMVFLDGVTLDHYPDPKKSRSSYLSLLELAVTENPDDDRMAYYLGREYFYQGRWEDCIAALKRHLSLPRSTWKEERCASMRWIAKSYHMLSQTQEAYRWYFRAISEVPYQREAYVECAQVAYAIQDWATCFFMTEQALKIKNKLTNYINMGYAWDSTPDDLCAIACYWLGMYSRSAEHARAALLLNPGDERLKNNLEIIENKLK
ncbi:MAG TPA: glycosyltransferase [Clostridiales bacterium]|nr:glycosyltransferase [Clostridiales bacterium]